MRRTWMLLLVTVLLAVFLAVPAMAADCSDCGDANHCATCGADHTDWTPISEAGLTVGADGYAPLTTSGKYYIDDDACGADGIYTMSINITADDIDVTICLNGKTWQGDGANRPLSLQAASTVNIVDCSTVNDGVSAGKIQGVDTSANTTRAGGAVYICANGKLNFYNGTIQGGYVGTTKPDSLKNTGASHSVGGNVYMTNGELNMFGGVITGGRAVCGGNVCMNDANSVFNLYRGTVSNGLATGAAQCRVGNIYVVKGTLNLGVADEPESNERNSSVRVIDGVAFYSNTDKTDVNCGNIWVTSNATMNMYYGTVSGGEAANSVGNIRLDGKLNMYGGVVRDGKITMGKKTVNGVEEHYVLTTPTNHNIQMNGSGARLNMTGGHIYGYFGSGSLSGGSIKLSGSAKIYTPDTDGDGLADDGLKAAVAPVLDKLNDDAKIAIQMATGSTLTYNEKSDITSSDWEKYVSTHQLEGWGSKWLIWKNVEDKGVATYVNRAQHSSGEAVVGYYIWHCVCGANSGEDHIGDCDKYDKKWTPYKLDGSKGLPKATAENVYYYYLVEADGNSDGTVEVVSTTWSGNDSYNSYFDLNGLELTYNGDNRMLVVYTGNLSTAGTGCHHLVFTDSSENHTGTLTCNSTKNDHSILLWMRAAGTGEAMAHQVEIYRVTVDGRGSSAATGKPCISLYTGTLKLFNTTVYGNTGTTVSGSAIFMGDNKNGAAPTLNVENSTIHGGRGASGGAIYVKGMLNNGTPERVAVTIKDSVIYGGQGSNNGGAIYVENANSGDVSVTVENSRIIGGKASNFGGAIYAKRTSGTLEMTLKNTVITNKNGEQTAELSATSGGAIYVDASDVTLEGCTVEGGQVLTAATMRNDKNATVCAGHVCGGNIYMNGGTLTLKGGTIIKTGTAKNTAVDCDGCRGGNLYVQAGTINLNSGTIDNGEAGTAGNIYLSSANTTMNMGEKGKFVTDELNSSVKVTSGKAYYKHGGNIYIGGAATLNLYYGTISDGKAKEQGGNIRVDGKMYMHEGIIKDAYTGQNFGLYAREDSNMLIYNAATFHMSGGHIHGHVKTLNYGATTGDTAKITLSGDAKIYATNSNPLNGGLYLDEDGDDVNRVALSGLTANAKVGFTCENAVSDRRLTVDSISGDCVLTGLFYCENTYKLRLGDDDHLYLVTPEQAIGAIVNDGSLVVTLPEAIEMATGTNDFVRMLSDYTGERLVVADNLNLDLNGKKIVNGLKLTGGELKLADSANADYVDNSITNGNRLTIETESGTIARAFVTGGFTNYGHNYRFLVLKHKDADENYTYSAHRIYLAVQNPVLYPVKAAMSFKTVLGCDATVAGYIGEYGVNAAGPDGSDKSNYLLNDGTVVLPYEGKNQNAMTTAVVNILRGAETDEDWSEANLSGQAYIKLNDYFYGKTKEGTPVVGEDVTSAQKGTSLQQLVKAIDGMTLSNPQKVAVAKMYTKHFTLMSNWGLEKIPDYADTAGKIERHCLCGDTSSTDNPCAATGHRQLDWQPLPENYKGERLYEGNYYLTKDLELTAQMDIVDGNMVCLDTNGHNITLKSDVHTRLAIVRNGAVFNLTNSQFATKESTGSASCLRKTDKDENGNGGILIGSGGNMSLYKGVTITAIEGHKIGYGLVAVNGSLNIYGGKIIGTTLDDDGRSSDGYGGAVYVGANGYFFINDGTIQAGDNNKKGGAIYTAGGETHIQGNAELVAGTGTQTGGLLFVAGGKVNVGVSLTGGQAELGAVATVTGGTLNLNGSVTVDGENATYSTVITGGTAQRGGAIFVAGGTLNVNGAKIAGGVANIYEATTTGEGDEAVTTTVTNPGQGGAIFVENGEVKLTNKAMVDGGQASNGGNFYITGGTVSITDSFVCNGYADRLTVTAEERAEGIYGKYGSGSNFYLADGNLELVSSTVEGGKADKDNSCDGNDVKDVANRGEPYGGSVLYASGGTVTVTDSKLLGNRSAEMWKHGGTIFNNGATITVKNSTITASYASTDGTVLYNNGTNASFTMTDTILDASVLDDVEGLESVTYAGAVRNVGADFTMNGDKSEICGFTIHHANGGGALYVTGADSTIVMNGGTISGGSGKDGDSYGGNVAFGGGTFTMNGGVITGGTTAANGGNVYISGGTFTMNGGSITGGSTSGSSSMGGGNVAITDGTFTMKGGVISGGTSSTNGGNVLVKDGTLSISGGTIGEETVAETKKATLGGNIYVDGGTLNISNTATLSNGHASKGGNIYMNGGSVTMSGGTITGGVADQSSNNGYGGNLYIANGATFNLQKGIIELGQAFRAGNVYLSSGVLNLGVEGVDDPEDLNDEPVITGGKTNKVYDTVTDDHNCGNLWVDSAGIVNMYYGTIKDGWAHNAVGNVRLNGGTLNMYGGVIKDGKAFSKNPNQGTGLAGSANMQITAGLLNMSGGHIHGYISTNDREKVVKVSGTAKIYAEDANGNITSGLSLSKNGDVKLMVGELLDGAKVAISKDADQIAIEAADGTPAHDTTNVAQAAQYVQEGKIVAYGGIQLTYEPADPETGTVGAIYTRAASAHYSCICAANIGEEHLGSCDGYDVLYNEWKLGGKGGHTDLPNPSDSDPVYYYLVDNDGTADNTYELLKQNTIGIGNSKNSETGEITVHDKVTGGRNVYIDFNGITLTTGEAFNNSNQPRMLTIASGKAAQHVTLLDSSEGHAGGLVAGEITREDHSNVFWMRNTYDENQDHYVEMYRINVDGSAVANSTSYAGINVVKGTLKMYDVNLTGGSVAKEGGHSGALQVCEGATVEIYGGTVTGGTTTGRAGGIYVLGDLTMKDVTVTGGTAKVGGNIFVNSKAKLDMENCTIENGKATLSGGGNVFINGGKVTMKGGSITGGEAWVEDGAKRNDLTESKPAVGGGVYLASGDFEVSGNVTIEKNYAYGYSIETKTDSVFDDIYVCDKSDNSNKFDSNLYLNGNAVKDAGLISGASIHFSMLEAEAKEIDNAYQGVFALSDSDSSAYFKPDNANAIGDKTLGYGDGKLYYGIGDTSTYLVGYGAASIQPTEKDLVTGMVMTGYGNDAWRHTDKTYTDDNTDENGLRTDLMSSVTDYENFSGLKATALAITDGQGETVIIMSTDAISSASNDLARKLISQATGVPVDNITISACHQHSTPECKTVYYVYQDADGNPILNEKGETQYADENNIPLPEGADPVIKTDYRRTYLAGVVQAAVDAYNDRKQATVSAGILDTASEDEQYNFVRNVTIKVKANYKFVQYERYTEGDNKNKLVKDENGNPKVLYEIQYLADEGYNNTDGHNGISPELLTNIKAAKAGNSVYEGYDAQALVDCFDIYYESTVDTTMQLVKFERDEKKPIVLANFQTHPHMAAGSGSQHVHADVVGAFRYYLETDQNGQAAYDVLYFSGAGGNVNTTPKLNDSSKSVVSGMNNETDAEKMERARVYGSSLAGLAKTFLQNTDNMTEVTNAHDVNVSKTKVTYNLQAFDASEQAVQNIINNNIVDWENGGYPQDPTKFFDNYWYELCGKYTYAEYGDKAESHRIYSAYDANRLRAKYQNMRNNKTTGEMTVMAYNIGGIGFVQAPYEMFQESGQAIKGNVPGSTYKSEATNAFDITIVATQANSSSGYIPTAIAYENGGGYSSTDNSVYAKDTAEMLVETYVGMLNGMYK